MLHDKMVSSGIGSVSQEHSWSQLTNIDNARTAKKKEASFFILDRICFRTQKFIGLKL